MATHCMDVLHEVSGRMSASLVGAQDAAARAVKLLTVRALENAS